MERIKVESVSYSYQNKYQTVEAVKEVTCTFETGKMYVITGESGSGKSTFLSLLAGLDIPKNGTITVDGEDLSRIDRDAYRREKVAVIYQAFHLFPLLTALENVMYPLEIQGVARKEARERAEEYLKEVGIDEKKFGKYPRMMSGGEQQRTAVARAMASGGRILLADEPTGNLDTENEEKIVELLISLAHDRDFTVIMVTHNRQIAERADVRLVMKDGRMQVLSERDVSITGLAGQ
ncbi:ABC transporter ATP-binding protein [Mediterraneibacter glycyrrhizinilyticus]|uniref:ABC transporter ATP-binding protein n=1 Tax=Candidatus Mediterraneibacter faecipullorum TaxID=2838670 RepID=A0A9D2SU52_9FIRM|nr:ABC transporter ATP-binding protein [Mediterraneibacter glycyrrhizinilyticus]MBM6802691.1 ABC transporter ATP-binding protein [Mediterraneibacter glycyrrhizinilyticus]MDM8125834.1 ABC transporter ATP-binding protein [Mediterraneibacter glycyrrhizinilyticus]MDM8210079.1 ABC transporter ATP-binding protein [Mediterraneibacter glycyrrhizinilyticus]HJC34005.1 ABC transporter ATP-binding protein [Candidatus Mediterraneibacter faecipullorum]